MQRCGGPSSNHRNGRVVEQTGYPKLIVRLDKEPAMLAFRDAVIRELKERFGVRAIAQAPPEYDSAPAGMVKTPSKRSKRKCELW